MRLFYFIIFLPAVLLPAFCQNTLVAGEEVQWIRGSILEDVLPGINRTPLLLSSWGSRSLTSGTGREITLILSGIEENHYAGEMVHIVVSHTRKGLFRSEEVEFSGQFMRRGQLIRAFLIEGLRRRLGIMEEPGYLLEALLLGKTDRIPRESALFRQAGVSHLLALSGLHRGIITALLLLFLRPMIPRRVIGPVILVILFAYSWLIGIKHSLIRAMIMYTLFVLADSSGVRPSGGKILILSAIVQLTVWSGAGKSLSFQLSYAAMAGIILMTRPFTYFYRSFLPALPASGMAVSSAAQIMVIPYLFLVFGKVQLLSIPAGLLLTPLITVYLWLGIISLPFLFSGNFLFTTFAYLLGGLYRFIIALIGPFSLFPFLMWEDRKSRLLFFFCLSVIILNVATASYLRLKGRTIGRQGTQIKLRFTIGNKIASGNDGAGPPQALGPEFSDKSRCQGENCQLAGCG